MKYVFGIVIIGEVFYVLHRLALWAEKRGWIYYRKAGSSSALGNALLEIQTFFEPSKKHIVEVRKIEHSETETAGDKPSSYP